MPFSSAVLAAIIAAHPNKATGTLTGGAPLQGIYTAPAKNIQLFAGQVSSTAPQFVIRAVDVETHNIDIGTEITINGTVYTVADTEERNDGMTGLPLTKDSQ